MNKRPTDAEIVAAAFRKAGARGGKARAAKLSTAELSAIGKKGALARWGKPRKNGKAAK